MLNIAQRIRSALSTLTITYRLPLLAALWIPTVGVGAYGLSKLAPEGEAAGGVVLAAIALGGYRLTAWALDLLAPLLVERLIWPLLGSRRQSSGSRGPAFSSAVRMLHYSGRDTHFGKQPELKDEIEKIKEHLAKIARQLEQDGRRSSDAKREYASLSPRRHVKVNSMMDLSGVSVGDCDHVGDEAIGDAVFEMPDGSYWKVASYIGGGLIRVKGLYGDEANEYIELVRIGK